MMWKILILLPLLVFVKNTVVYADENDNRPSVETKLGVITGTYKTADVFGKQMVVERYFGIPYAEPPVGDLRFRKPVPRKPFKSPFDATQFGNVCHQVLGILPVEDSRLSEDCLFLNVFVPSLSRRKGSLDVVIFIHGGGFIAGYADYALSDTLAAHGDVIVVTMNYRLSLWGFLSTGDKHAPGNYGLWDQHLAIQWVHNNIEAFGGDPGKVTLMGESAGAMSVIFQALFEGNKGLFQRGIAQSGSTAAPILAHGGHKKEAEKLGALLGCEETDTEKLVACIKSVPVDSLNETLNDFSNGLVGFPMAFIPNVDGEFVKEHPKDVLSGKTEISSAGRSFFSTVDLLTGINAMEGVIMMLEPALGIDDVENFEPNRTFYEETLIPMLVSIVFGPDSPDVLKDLVVHEYTDWTDPEDMLKRRQKVVNIFSDWIFSVPMIETVAQHEILSGDRSGTYMYLFDVTPAIHVLPTPSWVDTAVHGDEFLFLLYDETAEVIRMFPGFEDYTPSPWEREVAKNMMTMWTNFAKTGNPNKPTAAQMFWPDYTTSGQHYLHITRHMNSLSVKSHFLASEFNMWTKVLPAVKKAFEKDTPEDRNKEHCDKDSCQP